jgi:hypothetical protein
MHPFISKLLSTTLAYAPTTYLHSWLLYLGIQTTLPDATQEFAPLRNYCEFLNALHIYADEARRGVVRHVEANHFCSHLSKGGFCVVGLLLMSGRNMCEMDGLCKWG